MNVATMTATPIVTPPTSRSPLPEKISIRDLKFYYGDQPGAEEHQPAALRKAR